MRAAATPEHGQSDDGAELEAGVDQPEARPTSSSRVSRVAATLVVMETSGRATPSTRVGGSTSDTKEPSAEIRDSPAMPAATSTTRRP
ncbi:hypothetical protein SVIOM342S_01635 [Streptomyces violaceorubidus]